MRKVIIILIFYQAFCVNAAMQEIGVEEIYKKADVVFVGRYVREVSDGVILKSVYNVKGYFDESIVVCKGRGEDSLQAKNFGMDLRVIFLVKHQNCYDGVYGYKSILYMQKETGCVYSNYGDINKGFVYKVETFQKFLRNLGVNVVNSDEFVYGDVCNEY